MEQNTKKFSREIQALKALNPVELLHPLRQEQIRQAVMENISGVPQAARSDFNFIRMEKRHKILYYIVSTLLGLSILGSTAFASGGAMPGDSLYPVKRTKEKVQLALTFSEQAKAQLQAVQAQERLEELQEIKIKAQPQQVSPQNQKQQQLETETEHDALNQVNQALQTLTKVHTELKAKGNTRAAATLNDNIEKLKTQAHKAHLVTNFDDNNNNNKEQQHPFVNGSENDHGSADSSFPAIPGRGENQPNNTRVYPNSLQRDQNNVSPSPDTHENSQESPGSQTGSQE